MDKQKLYESAPLWLQNIAVNVEGMRICKRRYNRRFHEVLKHFENHDYLSQDELRRFMLEVKDVKAYKETYSTELVEALKDITSNIYTILTNFPIINKEIVKKNLEDYYNPGYVGELFTMRTSGTTGSGLAFPYPVDFENKQWAIWWRYRESIGIRFGTWCGWFGGKRIINPNINKGPYCICPGIHL